jgi:tRNA threonylcarbamoyladenosine biosynthesis protein TsaB
MKLMLLHTCGTQASLALADTELSQPIIVVEHMPGRSASEMLVAIVRKVLSAKRWKLPQLDALAVVTGPGSFTGVRVGLSAAKGLSEAVGTPMVAVSRLAMLAAEVPSDGQRVCAFLDAGRNEFYCGQYLDGNQPWEGLVTMENAVREAKGAFAVACEDSACAALSKLIPVRQVAEPTAAAALPFALQRIHEGSFDDPASIDASYLRRTDAEIFAHPPVSRVG